MSKTIYKVQDGPAGTSSPGPESPSGGSQRGGRGTLFWVLLSLLVVTLIMIVVIAALGATDSGAAIADEPLVTSPASSTASTAATSSTASTGLPTTTSATPPATAGSTAATDAVSSSTSSSSSTTTALLTHTIANPVRIVIPALKVDAKMAKVGLKSNGAMEIPKVGVVGWFGPGPVPGASGPCVVVSHVTYGGKKGAFYHLKDLKQGDQVLIYDKSGDVATFQVDSKETILKSALPTDRIWNNTKDAVLRLVTCGGEYDPQTKHYLSNVIVYGHLVK